MSDEIGHFCGIALIRLKKPLDYYAEKYGTYWEARARVKVRPESKKCFQNVHTESFDYEPTDEEATAQIERNNPHLKVERIEWVRDMTHKAVELTNHYNTKSFTGD